jgi:predicted anti-sigma-YlaC factor YlaD
MEHEQIKLLLSDYLDGTLQDDQRRDLESHLDDCAECRRELQLLQNTMQMVRTLPRAQAPAHFVGKVRRRARKAGLNYGRRMRRSAHRTLFPFQSSMTLAVLLAAVGALIVMVLLLQSQIEFTVEQPPPTVIQVSDMVHLNQLADLTWQSGGRVLVGDRQVPPQTPLGAAAEVDLILPASHWADFVVRLLQAGLAQNLPSPAKDKREVRVVVRLTSLP